MDTLIVPLIFLFLAIAIPVAIARWIFMIDIRVSLMRQQLAEQKTTNAHLKYLSEMEAYKEGRRKQDGNNVSAL